MIKVKKNIDTPWVVECNGISWYGKSPFANPVWLDWYKQKKVQKWEKADHVIVVSEKLKHQISKEGIGTSKISVIHNGVNVNAYRKISRKEILEFKSTQEFNEETIIGFMGHIHPKHKVEMFVDALRILSDMGYMIHGLVVGGGRWTNYRKYASKKGIKDKITFTGPLPPERVPVAVSSMDICTIPGVNNHDSPVKLFEYGAAGCPVVSVSTPNVKEVIIDGKNGILFDDESTEDFVRAISRLLENERLQAQYGAELRKKVESEHTWEDVGRRTEVVLNRVVDTTGGKQKSTSR
jgi:glycosyltransferase involved in cell wall biosynthesis